MKINKILIAVDDNKYAEHAAEIGFDMALLVGAEVGLVSIVAPLILPESSTDVITGLPMESLNIDEAELIKIQSESAENVIKQTIKKFGGDRKVTHFTEYGSTADGILKCSVEFNADLIVVGTHNRTGLNRLIMGSVSEHVVRHSHVPVLVVPLREES
jgi:nucleotide-binding universal stress UspA family protein